MIDAATERQNSAAQPDQSTWLSANAGSGKTRVLTNRVARLLLQGVSPQNILCLTYTKAAASEMQNRLFKTLGAWAMLSDNELRSALSKLGESPPADLSKARTLFASAIEAPGGLKIQTIHSLCSSILRQFPLEAGVNPQFREIDEAQQVALIEDLLDRLALQEAAPLERAAMVYPDETLTSLARDLARKAESFQAGRSQADIFAAFELAPELTLDQIVSDTFQDGDIAFLKSLVPILQRGRPTDLALASKLSSLPDTPSLKAFDLVAGAFLTGKSAKEPYRAKISSIPTGDLRKSDAFQPLLPELETIMLRVERARPIRVALAAAIQTVAIHDFADVFLPAYSAAKRDSGVLDFDDLIRHTRDLLTRRSMQWVMYRLDGRIDHILVDEAQDTSPTQWDVIEALADEMASGEGDRSRTLFVVGDKKQSIYSFQGADAAGFDRRAGAFHDRLADGQGLRTEELEFSFRSSPAILSVVDRVFGKSFEGRHQAYHADMAGRVDLWPLIPRPDASDDPPWYETGNRTVGNSASFRLADAVAENIQHLIKNGTIQGINGPRKIEPGDIMVLVQRRSALFDEIIQACKARSLDIAGADRLKIGSELAVRDLLALLSFLALPEDNLSLAAALRSPLFGWSEQDLYSLAAGRGEKVYLWTELRSRRNDFPETYSRLRALRDLVDYERPFELLDAILTRFGGRIQLLERLGPEAEDGINELLNQALAYERDVVPSLTGFLNTARASDIVVKRQSDTSGNLIRVMTVHGAKGLESPIVILPDTAYVAPRHSYDMVDAGGLPVIPLSEDKSPPKVTAAKGAKRAADEEERSRLLYVAMTRAEKWLIVCGVEPSKNAAKGVQSWYQMVHDGLDSAGAEPLEASIGQGLRFAVGDWPKEAEMHYSETESGAIEALPVFANALSPRVGKRIIAPSDLGGTKVLGGGAADEESAMRRGRQMHLLLEHLPGVAEPQRLAEGLLSHGVDAALPKDIQGLLDEALLTISTNPDVFGDGPLAEVEIVADFPRLNATIYGKIDRLLVSEDRVLAVDFKTNVIVPDAPGRTPEGLLRQMGAYLEALEQVYPDRRIEVAILWTATGDLMPLEHGIVREALLRAPTS